jgi:hypothetical protein
MARKEKSYETMIREGYGQGIRSFYKAWGTHRFSSRGVVSRVPWGIKNARVHLFFSEMEYCVFNIFDFDEEDLIIDIRENYPILPVEDTLLVAASINVPHPKDKKTGKPYVRSVDFIITYKDGSEVVYQVKQSDDLKKRTIEKFEIERRYFERKGIQFEVITEKEFSKIKAKNIADLKRHYNLDEYPPFNEMSEDQRISLIGELYSQVIDSKEKLFEVTNRFDEKLELPIGTGMAIFRHLVIRKIIKIDLETELFNGNRVMKIVGAKDLYER